MLKLRIFSKIKSPIFLLSLLSIATLASNPYTATCNSIELISDGDNFALSKKEAQELSKRLIDDPLNLLNELKKYEHELLECLNKQDSSFSREITQKKLDTNKFVTHRHKFNCVSTTKKTVCAGALLVGGIYAVRALKS